MTKEAEIIAVETMHITSTMPKRPRAKVQTIIANTKDAEEKEQEHNRRSSSKRKTNSNLRQLMLVLIRSKKCKNGSKQQKSSNNSSSSKCNRTISQMSKINLPLQNPTLKFLAI